MLFGDKKKILLCLPALCIAAGLCSSLPMTLTLKDFIMRIYIFKCVGSLSSLTGYIKYRMRFTDNLRSMYTLTRIGKKGLCNLTFYP